MDKLSYLTLAQLRFERDNRVLFEQLDCTLAPGDLLQIRGKNGCGKSTLLRIIAGLIQPHYGHLLWQNKPITRQYDTYRAQLFYLGHQNSIKPNLTVAENLSLHAALNISQTTATAIKQALQQVGLATSIHTLARHLSAGQARRLNIAKLILNPVPLWLLDEPLSALDSESQHYFNHLLQQHLSNQGIAVVATHQNLGLFNTLKTIHLGA